MHSCIFIFLWPYECIYKTCRRSAIGTEKFFQKPGGFFLRLYNYEEKGNYFLV